MEFKNILADIAGLSQIVDGWVATGDVSEIERDIALEKLRGIYNAIRFPDVVPMSEDVAEISVVPAAHVVIPVVPAAPEVAEDISIDMDIMFDSEIDDKEPIAVVEDEFFEPFADEVELAPVVEKRPEKPKQPQPAVASLFNLDDVESHRRKQRVIMSLYGEDPKPSVGKEIVRQSLANELPSVVEVFSDDDQTLIEEVDITVETPAKPMTEPKTVLGDVINHDVQTLADTLSMQKKTVLDITHGEHLTDLRKAIGVNDKFLIIRDLFNGNAAAYQVAIDELNKFEDLDDCMIHIAENYDWNPNSDGAKFIMELLERKFA